MYYKLQRAITGTIAITLAILIFALFLIGLTNESNKESSVNPSESLTGEKEPDSVNTPEEDKNPGESILQPDEEENDKETEVVYYMHEEKSPEVPITEAMANRFKEEKTVRIDAVPMYTTLDPGDPAGKELYTMTGEKIYGTVSYTYFVGNKPVYMSGVGGNPEEKMPADAMQLMTSDYITRLLFSAENGEQYRVSGISIDKETNGLYFKAMRTEDADRLEQMKASIVKNEENSMCSIANVQIDSSGSAVIMTDIAKELMPANGIQVQFIGADGVIQREVLISGEKEVLSVPAPENPAFVRFRAYREEDGEILYSQFSAMAEIS